MATSEPRIWCGHATVERYDWQCLTRVTVSFTITDQALMTAQHVLPDGDVNTWSRRLYQGAERGLIAAIEDTLPEGLRVRVDEHGIHLIPAWEIADND